MDCIYGIIPVLESLRAQRRGLQRIFVAKASQGDRINEILQAAKRAGVPVERRDRESLDDMARHARHQGVVGLLTGKSTYVDPQTVLEHLGPKPLVVLLDGIEDPHNLGAILRSCEGAGVDGVFLPEHRAAGLTDTVAKTSAGAVEHLRVARVTNLVPLIEELKQRGLWVVGVEGDGKTSYADFDLTVGLALIFGSEGRGMRRLVKERCDGIVSIPMRGRLNSLNVSVAAGVVLFEVLRQRASKQS
jgi:23S rRNA (guanosine2251-2'-O)-methyltransferase